MECFFKKDPYDRLDSIYDLEQQKKTNEGPKNILNFTP